MSQKPLARNIALDIVLTLLLCGLWNLVVQYEQIKTLNYLLKTEKYAYWKIYIYSLLTCGIYLIIFEYKKAEEITRLQNKTDNTDSLLAVLLAVVGLHWIYDALAQSKLNELLNNID